MVHLTKRNCNERKQIHHSTTQNWFHKITLYPLSETKYLFLFHIIYFSCNFSGILNIVINEYIILTNICYVLLTFRDQLWKNENGDVGETIVWNLDWCRKRCSRRGDHHHNSCHNHCQMQKSSKKPKRESGLFDSCQWKRGLQQE